MSEPTIEIRIGLGGDRTGTGPAETPREAATVAVGTSTAGARDGGQAPTGPEAVPPGATASGVSTTDLLDGGEAPTAESAQAAAGTGASGFGTAVQAEEAGAAPNAPS
jgi:hypothetical protein